MDKRNETWEWAEVGQKMRVKAFPFHKVPSPTRLRRSASSRREGEEILFWTPMDHLTRNFNHKSQGVNYRMYDTALQQIERHKIDYAPVNGQCVGFISREDKTTANFLSFHDTKQRTQFLGSNP